MEDSILRDIERTRGGRSTSERVNELLRRALDEERRRELENEAAVFYSVASRKDREEERAFQRATRRALRKD